MEKAQIVNFFMEKNILINPDIFESNEHINKIGEIIQKDPHHFNEIEFLDLKLMDNIWKRYNSLNSENIVYDQPGKVVTVFNYDDEGNKKTIQDFVKYFNNRLKQIEQILTKRQELSSLVSIRRILGKTDRSSVAFVGIVYEKLITKNNNIMLTLEDETGMIKVLINKNRPELLKKTKDIMLDEVIGITGTSGDKIVFANDVIIPDIPITKELKKCQDEVYAIFLSDIHIGSKYFLKESFEKFLKWIRQESGNEKQKEMANKVRYIFIAGDLVDGVGIYPSQEEELTINNIYDQYKECAEYFKKIPKHIKIIICPGNHDAVRIAEPQPKLDEDFIGPLLEMDNVILVTNPSIVNIHQSDDFEGFDVLMYHGYSFDYYIPNVETIWTGGGYKNTKDMMKYILQRRHLAPTHTSTRYIPDTRMDPLVISKVPDFFITGHTHYNSASNYRNITMINGSCFQAMTAFQEKLGHSPEPGKITVVNLQTRGVKIINFS